MNDYDLANKMVGNRFDLVLIASERMRELHKIRRQQEELGTLTEQQRRQEIPARRAISDIENGVVGREMLLRVKTRVRKNRQRFDDIK